MKRETALGFLAKHKPHLQREFGVSGLALFGSTARGTAKEDSDVDVLISFAAPATSQQYFGAQFYLEDILQCHVDLVSDKAVRKELRSFIERDAVHV